MRFDEYNIFITVQCIFQQGGRNAETADAIPDFKKPKPHLRKNEKHEAGAIQANRNGRHVPYALQKYE